MRYPIYILSILAGLLAGLLLGILGLRIAGGTGPESAVFLSPLGSLFGKREVIGFMPYWLLSKETPGVTADLTTLAYFGVSIDADGSILKLTSPVEAEPGWHALRTGIPDPFFRTAKQSGDTLSLVAFSGDKETIDRLMDDPEGHAKTLAGAVVPVMQQYGMTDLNLDIERVGEASADGQLRFTRFVRSFRDALTKQHPFSLSIDVTATDFVKHDLIDPVAISPLVDRIIIMAYDFHYTGSAVTGPVAPLSGGGQTYEYDTQTAVRLAVKNIPGQKIILGLPLYGYEWETVSDIPHAAVIPGTGIVASNRRAETLLSSCASCSAEWDAEAAEPFISFRDAATGSYHWIAYPDARAVQAKLDFAAAEHLGGVALWALGYESPGLLTPLPGYKR
ncbi:glycosyl hydrolase family 18 protein [Patescibacteria group bacterium]|nr:glycosyl hydrolase family 18 protein [Patescibacteria group bacterium]